MATFNDLDHWVETVLHPQPIEYTKRNGNVMHLDASGLKRPLTMNRQSMAIMLVLVVAGIIIGIWIMNSTVFEAARQFDLSQANVTTNLERQSSSETLPGLANYAALSDEDIISNIQGNGYNIYNATSESDSGITVYKLPSDVSAADAAILYSRGVSNLTASQAALLLNGSWQLNTNHDSGNTIVLRYADFKSSSTEEALSLAMEKEGLASSSIEESGTDESGNTYRSGKLDANDKSYTWRASAIELSKIYSIKGMPDSAYYVGVRLTEN